MTDLWEQLRRTTQARIGLGRAGNALPTPAELEFRSAHAEARDAVHDTLDVDDLARQVASAGFGDPLVVRSRAATRDEYLRRPDLGRVLAEPLHAAPVSGLVVVLADGLSARAVSAHAVPLLVELARLTDPPDAVVVATQARVALGDRIGESLGAAAVLVLIGERPGLSVTDSLGAYLTYAPRAGRHDAERNCVSNIHPPDGLGYPRAARAVAGLLAAAIEAGESGVRIKDRSDHALPAGGLDALPS
ncbi:ethanolamine ammonia-lyase subunit EutC [Jatrophihabitans sp. YIM 134969]